MMIHALIKFIGERFHPKVTVLLAVILFSAPYVTVPQNPTNYYLGVTATFLMLLVLRMADDLTSIKEDTAHHPERGMVSGIIDVKGLWGSLLFLVIFIFLINFLMGEISILIFLFSYYGLFFLLKKMISFWLKPFFSNLIFFSIPYFATDALWENDKMTLFLGLFLWTGAISHEFSHDVEGSGLKIIRETIDSNDRCPQKRAIFSLILFGCSLFCAIFFWQVSKKPFWFICVLIPVVMHMLFLYYKLIKEPSRRNAKPFYIFGFTFFLLPCCAYIIDSLI